MPASQEAPRPGRQLPARQRQDQRHPHGKCRRPTLQPCSRCLCFWQARAAEVYAEAVARLTRREIDLDSFAAELASGRLP